MRLTKKYKMIDMNNWENKNVFYKSFEYADKNKHVAGVDEHTLFL